MDYLDIRRSVQTTHPIGYNELKGALEQIAEQPFEVPIHPTHLSSRYHQVFVRDVDGEMFLQMGLYNPHYRQGHIRIVTGRNLDSDHLSTKAKYDTIGVATTDWDPGNENRLPYPRDNYEGMVGIVEKIRDELQRILQEEKPHP